MFSWLLKPKKKNGGESKPLNRVVLSLENATL